MAGLEVRLRRSDAPQQRFEHAEELADVPRRIVAVHGDADAPRIVHHVDIFALQRRVQLGAARMLEGEDARSIPAAHRFQADVAETRLSLGD